MHSVELEKPLVLIYNKEKYSAFISYFGSEEVFFMNKWVSVALCICGLGLGGMMLTGDSDGGRVLIENAPYITDGKINPDHEGKVVIVAGKLKTEEPAADEELGISFDSPIIRRNVHVMVEKGSGSDIKRSWESMASSNIARMYKSAPPVITFYGVVKAGDFILDKTLLKNLPPV